MCVCVRGPQPHPEKLDHAVPRLLFSSQHFKVPKPRGKLFSVVFQTICTAFQCNAYFNLFPISTNFKRKWQHPPFSTMKPYTFVYESLNKFFLPSIFASAELVNPTLRLLCASAVGFQAKLLPLLCILPTTWLPISWKNTAIIHSPFLLVLSYLYVLNGWEMSALGCVFDLWTNV